MSEQIRASLSVPTAAGECSGCWKRPQAAVSERDARVGHRNIARRVGKRADRRFVEPGLARRRDLRQRIVSIHWDRSAAWVWRQHTRWIAVLGSCRLATNGLRCCLPARHHGERGWKGAELISIEETKKWSLATIVSGTGVGPG